ncbi:helix-turn-helix domain-containing protein [Geoglobus sp.]
MKGIKDAVSSLTCDNILECFYGLNESDVQIYRMLAEHDEMRIEEISRQSGRSENTTYKSLQKLMMAGIVLREKRVIKGGGYYYTYRALPPDEVAEMMERILEEWCVKVRDTIIEFKNSYRR